MVSNPLGHPSGHHAISKSVSGAHAVYHKHFPCVRVAKRPLRVRKHIVPQEVLCGSTAKSPRCAKPNAILTQRTPRSRSLQEIVLLRPHNPNGRVTGRVHQGRGTEDPKTEGSFKAPEPTQIRLINQVSAARPSISLVNKSHPLKHEETQMLPGFCQLRPDLGANGAGLADEGWGSMETGVTEPPTSRETTAERFTNTNTPQVVRSTTREKHMAIKREAGKRKTTQMLSVVPSDPFMTAHAGTLPAPDATLSPGVWKAGPTIWGEGENEHNKVSAEQHMGC